ncbi:MAG: hypothetical protein ACT7A5_16060 [Ferrovibrionaceae bacterium]
MSKTPVFVKGVEETFTAIARVNRPNDDDGFDVIPLRCRFRVLGLKRQTELTAGEDADEKMLQAVLISVSGDMQDQAGNVVTWDDETRADMLDRPYYKSAILGVYFDRINGRKRGN